MASGDTLLILTPQGYTPPTTDYATLGTITGGASGPPESFPCLDFDDSADEYADFHNLKMPQNYGDSGVDVILVWACPGEVTVTEEVRWEAAMRLIEDDSNPLTTAHTYVYQGVSADPPSVANEVAIDTIALTTGAQMDSVTAGSYFTLRIHRDYDHADDTATGDARLLSIEIQET